MQSIKEATAEGYFLWNSAHIETKAKAKFAIKQELGRSPVCELPYYRLFQIAQGIWGKSYSPYLEAVKETNINQ